MRNPETTRLYKQFKENASCVCCSEDASVTLEFHHVDPSTKKATVSQLVKRGASWPEVLEEMKKTVTVCSNCHRKIHAGLIDNPELK